MFRTVAVSVVSAGALMCECASTGAMAQPTTAPQVIEGATAADIIGFFQAAGVSAKDVTQPGDLQGKEPFRNIEVSLGEGATFYVGMRGCSDTTPAARCFLIQPYVLLGSMNFPLGSVNAFNYGTAMISTLVIDSQGSLLMATKLYMVGGVTSKNLFTNISIFVSDISRVVGAIQKGGAGGSTIAYRPGDARPAEGYAAGFAVDMPQDAKVNWIGKATKNVDPALIEALERASDAQ